VRNWQRLGTAWWAGVAYAGLTVVMTWPMAIRLSLPYAPIQGDLGYWLWNFWWMKKALVELGTSPYFTSYLFHPTGTSLVFHNLSPYHGLMGIPIQLLGADVLTTYNLLYLSSFPLSGVGMFLLVRELTGNPFASFFAGAVYAFSPSHTLAYQWTDMWAIQWLPFAVLFALRVFRVARILDGIALAIALTLATLTEWTQPVILLVAILALALSLAFSRRQPGLVAPGVLRRLLWSLLLYGLLVSPLGYVVLRELGTGDLILKMPSHHPFELVGLRGGRGDLISYGVLLGWIPVAFVTYGIARGLDFWMKRLAALLIVFFILSLGEGLSLPGLADTVLPLPFVLWRKIPFLGTMRNAGRFWPMVEVCVAVLAGHGARKLWVRMEECHPRKSPLFWPVIAAGLLALMLIEVVQAPLTPVPLRIHPVYEGIRRDGVEGAILNGPTRYTTAGVYHTGRSMYFQTLHDRPLVGGFTNFDTRSRVAYVELNPVLALFMEHSGRAENTPDGVEDLRAFLAKHQVRWIILQKSTRDPLCDQRRIPGWSMRRFLNLVAPALVNEEVSTFRGEPGKYCGSWDAVELQKANALVRRTLGPPLWDDAELVAYRVR